ncbi:MAG: hypothetical protein NZ908_02250 [Candidatus Micrarchaeota archaeon]|nr:hypothetical protein [Candidatus Micrarchaeota archaeon]MCX8154516.1 hypothetical protein [Candidatus Micrarchaeota archaeon]
MRAQISLEFLYVNSIAIITTLFVISLFVSYFSSSFALPERCVMPYFLSCESMYINSTHLIINLRNNFDYSLSITRIEFKNTTYQLSIRLNRGENSTIILSNIGLSKNSNAAETIRVFYRPDGANTEFLMNGRISGRVRE